MYVSAVMISAPAILVTGRTSTVEFPVNLCKFGKDVSTVGRVIHLHLACVIYIWNLEQSVRNSRRVEPDENHIHANWIFLTQQVRGLDYCRLFNLRNTRVLRIVSVISKVVWVVSWLARLSISILMNRRITCCALAGRRNYDRSAMKAASHWFVIRLQIAALERYDSVGTDLTGHGSKLEVACWQVVPLPTSRPHRV